MHFIPYFVTFMLKPYTIYLFIFEMTVFRILHVQHYFFSLFKLKGQPLNAHVNISVFIVVMFVLSTLLRYPQIQIQLLLT
jgi:hypothetical protein